MLALGLPGPGTEGFGVELLPFGRRPSSGPRSFSTATYPPAAATIAVKSFCYCSVSATPVTFEVDWSSDFDWGKVGGSFFGVRLCFGERSRARTPRADRYQPIRMAGFDKKRLASHIIPPPGE